MREMFRAEIERLLERAVDCEMKREITEELAAHLEDKYNDLCQSGMDPEMACAAVLSGLGSMDELVETINRQNGAESDSFDVDKFAQELGGRFEQLAEDIRKAASEAKGPLKKVGRELKNAAHEAKGPLMEAARELKHIVMGESAAAEPESREASPQERVLSGAGLTGIRVELKSARVVIGRSPDDCIRVTETGGNGGEQLSVAEKEGMLCIHQLPEKASSVWREWLGAPHPFSHVDVTLLLPDRVFSTVEVETINGGIGVEGLRAECMEVHSVSGSVSVAGMFEEVEAGTVSGELRVCCDGMPNKADLETVSGDLTMALPENDGFTFTYQRMSGAIRTDFELGMTFGGREGTGFYREEGRRHYHVSTVSGSIHIARM